MSSSSTASAWTRRSASGAGGGGARHARRAGCGAGPRRRPGGRIRPPGAAMSAPLYELPEELRIDTAIARRITAEFIRGQLRQAGFERVVLGLSGGVDSALVAYLVTEAIGAEHLLCVLMPYASSSADSRSDAEEVVRRRGCARRG